jgi:hypothetical protein
VKYLGPVGIPMEYLGIPIPGISFGIPTAHLCRQARDARAVNNKQYLKAREDCNKKKIS